MQARVYHGSLNVLGCVLTMGDSQWHRIVSDPRKNMLIDLKNESTEEETKDLTIEFEDKTTRVNIGTIREGSTVLGIKEYLKYSEAEE